MDEIAQYIVQLGLSVCLVVFFVWRDFVREGHTREEKRELTNRIKVVEDGVRAEVLALTKQAITAIDQCTAALERCTQVTDRLEHWLDKHSANV